MKGKKALGSPVGKKREKVSDDDFKRACRELEEVLAGKRTVAEGMALLRVIDKRVKAKNAEIRQKRAELKKRGIKVPTRSIP